MNNHNTDKALICFIFLFFFLSIMTMVNYQNYKKEVAERFATLEQANIERDNEIAYQKEEQEILKNETSIIIATKDDEIEELKDQIGTLEVLLVELESKIQVPQYTGVLTKSRGVTYYEGHKETWYNLPMEVVVSVAHSRGLEGEFWTREDGAKMLGEYVMIAADQSLHPYGSLVETSLGTGIVVDTGSFIYAEPTQIDIAVNW